MPKPVRLADNEADLNVQIQALLVDPAHQDNPLREPLAHLLACNQVRLYYEPKPMAEIGLKSKSGVNGV